MHARRTPAPAVSRLESATRRLHALEALLERRDDSEPDLGPYMTAILSATCAGVRAKEAGDTVAEEKALDALETAIQDVFRFIHG
jgi:hypothetical protein